MRTACALALAVLLSTGCTDMAPGPVTDPLDEPIQGLDGLWRERFVSGHTLFHEVYVDATGLGPVYIRADCASCHAGDGRSLGTIGKMAILGADGLPLRMPAALPYGATVRPLRTSGATLGIEPPMGVDGLFVANRVPPGLVGRGYLEAIADSELERVEAAQAALGGIVSGRANRVAYASLESADLAFHAHLAGDPVLGRFGVKARSATIDDFVADAFQSDLGLTSALRTEELPNPDGLVDDDVPGIDVDRERVSRVADYLRLLAIPPRTHTAGTRGEALFRELGCESCHVPSLHTRADYPIAQLANIEAPIYSDLLLHEMGGALSDGQLDGDASASEFRTSPLIGLRFFRRFLHDGRAPSVDDAIRFHGVEGSEAAGTATAFEALAPADRDELVRFVTAL